MHTGTKVQKFILEIFWLLYLAILIIRQFQFRRKSLRSQGEVLMIQNVLISLSEAAEVTKWPSVDHCAPYSEVHNVNFTIRKSATASLVTLNWRIFYRKGGNSQGLECQTIVQRHDFCTDECTRSNLNAIRQWLTTKVTLVHHKRIIIQIDFWNSFPQSLACK